MSCLASFGFQVSSPGISGSSPFPLSLGIPGQGLACDVGRRFSEGVPNPSPFTLSYLLLHLHLFRPMPEVFVVDGLGPEDSQYLSEAAIDKGLDLANYFLGRPPSFRAI